MSTWGEPQDGAVETQGIVRLSSSVRAMAMRAMMAASSMLPSRQFLANLSGYSYNDVRDLFEALGYDRTLTPAKYRHRYNRGGITGRLVEAKPQATWRGGGELIEDEDPDTNTTFEQAWVDLNKKHNVWQMMERADKLGRLGRYAVILLGGPGNLDEPLEKMGPSGLLYLSVFGERDAQIESLDIDPQSERFAMPVYYNLLRLTSPLQGIAASMQRRVHYSRIVHIAEGLLDDNLYGEPALERVWNLLDDLDKVVGAGSEAFWRRIDAGMHFDMDPTLPPMEQPELEEFDKQLEDYKHGLSRYLRTRGIEVKTLTAPVASFRDQVNAIVSLLSAATGIPQRVLLGSERGELASSQDRDEWNERIADRRINFAGPMIVRPLIDKLIALGALPEPKEYDVRWPAMKSMDDAQKVEIAGKLAEINKNQGETVVTTDELRDRYLGLPPIEEVLSPEELAKRNAPPPPVVQMVPGKPAPLPAPKPTSPERRAAKWAVLTAAEKSAYLFRAAKRKEAPAWKRLHQAADRFPRRHEGSGDGRL